MPIKSIVVCTIAAVTLFSAGCKGKHQNPDLANSTKSSMLPSPEKTDTTAIQPETLSNQPLDGYVECSGTLVIPESEIVLITPPYGGVVKSIHYKTGNYVQSGTALLTVENIEFLKLQQEYLEYKSQYSYYSEDMKRQGELTIENASSVKKMQLAQMDYERSEIRFRSLAKQLALYGFTADSVEVDHFSALISITAPVSGYIDKIFVREGNDIAPGKTLLTMVRNYNPVLVMEIPQKHFRDLRNGQSVDFFLPGDSMMARKASLYSISKQIDPQKLVIKVRAMPAVRSQALIPGMQVKVRFSTNRASF